MIYIIIGTRGQFMKMFPVMKLLDRYEIPYKFINTCQHYGVVEKTRKKLGIRKPDVYLTMKKEDIKNVWDFFQWAPKVLWNARKLLIKRDDYVVIHGDTESSLLALFVGLYFRAKIVHVEAGLRSGDLLNPFPEEIVRNIVDFFSDINFCPTKKDAENIKNKKTIYVTNGNTIYDSIGLALKLNSSPIVKEIQKEKYALFLFHRIENLFAKKKIERAIGVIRSILKNNLKVVCILHKNTVYEIKRKNLWSKLLWLKSHYKLDLYEELFDYVDFMHLVNDSQFVVSDGGGLQEETYYMNKPLLILRNKTERAWGLGETACLSNFDDNKINYFLNNAQLFRRKYMEFGSPSKLITDFFIKRLDSNSKN